MKKPQLPTDTELLNYIEQRGKSGMKWIARESVNGRGFRLHNTTGTDWDASFTHPTAREAIAAEMEQFPMIWHSKSMNPSWRGRRCRVDKFKDNLAVIVFPNGTRVEGYRTWLRRA